MSQKEVLVAGIPRCGTTYVFRSLAGLPQGSSSPKGAALERLPIMKAHSLAPPDGFGDPWEPRVRKHVESGGKTIFMFGDPVLAVASTIRTRMDHVHAANCGCFRAITLVDLRLRDEFHYEKMFDTWTSNRTGGDVLCLRYEALDKIQKMGIVEAFLGRKVKWLPLRKRATSYDSIRKQLRELLESTYHSLIQKVNAYPDVTVRFGR